MSTPRPTPPPVFAFTLIPFGTAVGYVSIAAPYWLAQQGVSLAQIGAISATSMMPHAVKFLWAPLLDIGSRRKAWFILMAVLTAALTIGLALVPAPAQHLALWTLMATLLQIAGTTSAIASDGLMASTTREGDRGKAGGWRMAGNVGGTGLLGALALWAGSRWGVPVAGVALAVVTLGSIAAALTIEEAHPLVDEAIEKAGSAIRAMGLRLAAIGRDLWATVSSRDGWTGLVICLMPVGAGALTNLFSAMAHDYQASENVVAMVNGLGGGISGALGSLVGGVVADRMNRRLAYALSGGITALAGLAMMVAPMTPLTYAWGTLVYSFANGIAFATLAAFILEMVGHSVASATKYTVFIAIANVASDYVTALDGLASEFRGWGARGSILADAILTFVGIAVLLVMVRVNSRRDDRSAAAAML